MAKSNRNYYDTFITIAPDCPAESGTVPPGRGARPTKAQIEYDILSQHPYQFTQEEVLFEVHVRHKGLALTRGTPEWEAECTQFLAKPQACLRASPLAKQFGWGFHFNAEGKVALVACESDRYARLAKGHKEGTRVVAALRSNRSVG